MRAVLTYHSIDSSGSAISVPPEAFDRHVRWLASDRVRVVPLEVLAAVPDGVHAVAITFDDGFENFATVAAPRLAAHGLPATVFVVSDSVGGTNAWHGTSEAGIPTLPLLGWSALERLVARGVTVGAHSSTHRDLTGLDPAALTDEIDGCAERLRERLGIAPRTFAYPYGRVNAPVARHVAAAFACACTTELRPLASDDHPALLPRLDMYYFQEQGQIEAWGTFHFLRRITVRRGLRRLRSMMSARSAQMTASSTGVARP